MSSLAYPYLKHDFKQDAKTKPSLTKQERKFVVVNTLSFGLRLFQTFIQVLRVFYYKHCCLLSSVAILR